MSARDRIKAALDTVPGITGYAAEPDQVAPGVAWPVLRELNLNGVLCTPYTRTYEVFAVLPNGYGPRTAQIAEDLIEPLVEALRDVGEWTPPADLIAIRLTTTDAAVPGIRVRITPDPEE